MKFNCIKDKLKEKIIQAEKITGKNLSLPILSSIFLKAKNNKLIIRATNLDLGIEFKMPVKVTGEGEVAVPGSILSNVLTNFGIVKNINIELVNNNLVISSEDNTVLVKSFNAEYFPTIPPVVTDNTFVINSRKIVSGIKSVWYSSAMSDIKPEIASVYIYYKDNKITFVSTDSFRLAEKSIKTEQIKDFEGVIVPIKNITEIVRILESLDGDITVSVNDNQISFTADGLYLTSRIVNGVYPDYKQIIPKSFSLKAIVLKSEIENALRLTNIFTDKFSKINLKANSDRNILEISSNNEELGENVTQIKSKTEGESIDVNFNFKYINDSLQTMKHDSIVFNYDSDRDVLIIKDASDETFLYLVKPMNK